MSSFTPCARGFSIWITAFAFIASCAAAAAQDRSWVERSDRNTAMVFETLGAFYPEWMSHLGLDRFDPYVIDLKPGRNKRLDATLAASVKRLAGAKDGEGDVRVREDLEIVIDALERMRRTRALEERLLVPYFDAPQLRAHCAWVRSTVLPRARATPQLPRELYADRLVNVGVDISPEQAIALGTTTFAEVREAMTRLTGGDYRERLRELKREAVAPENILSFYRERLGDIEKIIAREKLVSLPQRPASIRLASEAESAAVPAPHLQIPRLIGNRGEVGEFVLPLANPNAKSGARMDDFTSPGAAWTLTAHEARPGHELQFATMVERGVSLARAVFASNSTNAEGWGLYAEAVMLPYFPAEGQLFGLQLRMHRAARAFLDPMINLGRMTPEAAKEYLMREVTLSEPFAQQEVDRYAFDSPGQAVSYLYGYSRLRELRLKAEIALGEKFNQQELHDLILAQGLLPAGPLERAVLEELTRRYPGASRTRASLDSGGSRSARDAQGR